MKKRILPLLLAFVLALPIVLVNIVAESLASTAVLTVEEAWINPGDTVEIDLVISENPGVLGATLTVWWDEGLMKMVNSVLDMRMTTPYISQLLAKIQM